MQATFVLVWLLVRLQSEREKRLRKGEEEQDERPNSAWLRSLAAEDLPRCRIHLPMTRVFAILFLTPNEAQVRVLPERWAGRSCDWAHCVRRKVRQRLYTQDHSVLHSHYGRLALLLCSGEVSCPVLQKRREKLLRRDDSPSAHDAAGQEVEIEEAEVETKAGTSAEALTGGREHGKERDGVESEAAAKRRRKAQALQVVCMCVRVRAYGCVCVCVCVCVSDAFRDAFRLGKARASTS